MKIVKKAEALASALCVVKFLDERYATWEVLRRRVCNKVVKLSARNAVVGSGMMSVLLSMASHARRSDCAEDESESHVPMRLRVLREARLSVLVSSASRSACRFVVCAKDRFVNTLGSSLLNRLEISLIFVKST